MPESYLPHLLFVLAWAILFFALLLMPVVWHALRRAAPRLMAQPRLARMWERGRARMGTFHAYLPTMALLAAGIAITLMLGEDFVELAVLMRQESPLVLDVDQSIYRWAASMRSNPATRFFLGFTHLGGPWGLAILSFAVAALLWARKNRRHAIYVVFTGGASGLINLGLKAMFERARPDLAEALRQAHGYSFPSGHAMGSMVVLGALAYVVLHFRWHWRMRALLASLLLASVIAVGISRVYLGVHWISDIAAGYAAGLMWLVIATLAFDAFWRVRQIRAKRSTAATMMLTLLLLVGCASTPRNLDSEIDRIIAAQNGKTIAVA